MATLTERLAAKTDTSGAHHRWLGATAADGTPQIRVNGRLTTVRRVVWEQTHGILGAGVTVAACPDDPRCVRLEHLSLGRKPRQRPEADTPPRAPGRSGYGTGSKREVRPGVWQISAGSGPNRRWRTIRGDADDAALALAGLVAETSGTAGTLDGLIATYLTHLEAEGRRPTTTRRYHQLWRQWLSPTLTGLRPATLDVPDLEAALDTMANAGQSHSSIHQAAVLLSGALTWAQRQGQLKTNPARGLQLPDGTPLGTPRQR